MAALSRTDARRAERELGPAAPERRDDELRTCPTAKMVHAAVATLDACLSGAQAAGSAPSKPLPAPTMKTVGATSAAAKLRQVKAMAQSSVV